MSKSVKNTKNSLPEKHAKMPRKLILTSKWSAEQQFTSQNTQHFASLTGPLSSSNYDTIPQVSLFPALLFTLWLPKRKVYSCIFWKTFFCLQIKFKTHILGLFLIMPSSFKSILFVNSSKKEFNNIHKIRTKEQL